MPDYSPNPQHAAVGFASSLVQPPSSCYIAADDSIILSYQSNTSSPITIDYRILDPAGFIQYGRETITPIGDRSLESKVLAVQEGFLLSLSFGSFADLIAIGRVYMRAFLQKGLLIGAHRGRLLCCGYVSEEATIGWPDVPRGFFTDGLGRITNNSIGNPAPGAEWTITVPTGALWRFRSIRAVLTASATVATRLTQLQFLSGGLTLMVMEAPNSVTAGNVRVIEAGLNISRALSTTDDTMLSLPDIWLAGSCAVSTLTDNIQVGDQYSSIHYQVEEHMAASQA